MSLINNKYATHTDAPLAERIDNAWGKYCSEGKTKKEKKEALEFLIYAFDISSHKRKNINQILLERMTERNAKKVHNPEYIPGKTPKYLTLSPAQMIQNESELPEHYFTGHNLLKVNSHSKEQDKNLKPPMLTAKDRASHRVLMYKGKFYHQAKILDTGSYLSHNKTSFAAFTFNLNGELSIFTHKSTPGEQVHSSMNAGQPVVCAGELQIKHGKLVALTDHSGHYQPSLYSLYQVLKHFHSRGIDIQNVNVLLHSKPENIDSKPIRVSAVAHNGNPISITRHQVNGMNLLKSIDGELSSAVNNFHVDLKKYQKSTATHAYHLKDFFMGKNLTKARKKLTKDVMKKIGKISTQSSIEKQIESIEEILDIFEAGNKNISSLNKKDETSGRLIKIIQDMKVKLEDAKNHRENTVSSLRPMGPS